MESKKNIVFLGMMGSGKTSIGYLVSKKLNLKFFDIDKVIEKKLNMKINEIFKIKGEIFFRRIEQKITLKILKNNKSVISLGGGGFLDKKIREEILKNHFSFWLKCNPNTIIKRVRKSSKRPIVSKISTSSLIDLLRKRSKIYSKASKKINCDNLNKTEIVNKVLENL